MSSSVSSCRISQKKLFSRCFTKIVKQELPIEKYHFKVIDRDLPDKDDFMGEAWLDLTALGVNRYLDNFLLLE